MSTATVSASTERKVKIALLVIGAIGGLTALILYPIRKKNETHKHELFELDKQIKELQLQKLRQDMGKI